MNRSDLEDDCRAPNGPLVHASIAAAFARQSDSLLSAGTDTLRSRPGASTVAPQLRPPSGELVAGRFTHHAGVRGLAPSASPIDVSWERVDPFSSSQAFTPSTMFAPAAFQASRDLTEGRPPNFRFTRGASFVVSLLLELEAAHTACCEACNSMPPDSKLDISASMRAIVLWLLWLLRDVEPSLLSLACDEQHIPTGTNGD